MQIIRRHQQLQAQLRRYLHVRHVLLIFMLEVVVEVLADFFQHDAAVVLQMSKKRTMSAGADVVRRKGSVRVGRTRGTHLIVPNVHRPEIDSANEPIVSLSDFVFSLQHSLQSFSFFRRASFCGRRVRARHVLCGSNIFFIVPATLAASRLTMNSKPSLEMRVT